MSEAYAKCPGCQTIYNLHVGCECQEARAPDRPTDAAERNAALEKLRDAAERVIPKVKPLLPTDAQRRKELPLARGLLDYFPAALAEVARVSYWGNQKHNPGCPIHWSRGKSDDHADCLIRHVAERGKIDTMTLADGRTVKIRHSAYAAWRALAILQLELEEAGEVGIAVTPVDTGKPAA